MNEHDLFNLIAQECHSFGFCGLGNPELTQTLGVCRRTIQRHLKRFKQNGLISIEIDKSKHQTTRTIWLIYNSDDDRLSQKTEDPCS